MTNRRWILGLLLALMALAGHIWYHYLPRARPAVPRGDSRVAALIEGADFPAALWMPYPHQNLAYLRRIIGAEPGSVRAVARLSGLPSPTLPSFGPLPLPPSSEIAVASDDAGERFVVVAEVYPAIAAFARLAGRLAGNPWLGGGEIVVEGRPAEVRWQENRWSVASADLAPEAASPPTPAGRADTGSADRAPGLPPEATPGLALIRIRQAVDPLPAGLYRLWENHGDVGITTGAGTVAPASPGLAGRLETFGLFLLVYSGRQPALGEPAQALAFFDQEAEKLTEIPRVAALHEPDAERWELPGEDWLGLAQRNPSTAAAGGWSIAAYDSISLERARRVAPELNKAAGDPAIGDRLRWGLWLDLRGGMAEVDRIARQLSKLPIVPRRLERWNDARRALSPLVERYCDLTVTVTDEPRIFDLRLKAVAAE